jgi:hypothetical protein
VVSSILFALILQPVFPPNILEVSFFVLFSDKSRLSSYASLAYWVLLIWALRYNSDVAGSISYGVTGNFMGVKLGR